MKSACVKYGFSNFALIKVGGLQRLFFLLECFLGIRNQGRMFGRLIEVIGWKFISSTVEVVEKSPTLPERFGWINLIDMFGSAAHTAGRSCIERAFVQD